MDGPRQHFRTDIDFYVADSYYKQDLKQILKVFLGFFHHGIRIQNSFLSYNSLEDTWNIDETDLFRETKSSNREFHHDSGDNWNDYPNSHDNKFQIYRSVICAPLDGRVKKTSTPGCYNFQCIFVDMLISCIKFIKPGW